MTYERFQDLISDLFKRIHAEKIPEALALLSDNRDVCSDRTEDETWMCYRMCLLSYLGQHEEAIDQFQEALDLDHWFPPFSLEDDDEDLKFLVGNPRYEELRKISITRYEEAAAKAKPQSSYRTLEQMSEG